MDSGRWLRLYACLEESECYRDSGLLHTWIHLLIQAKKAERPAGAGDASSLKPGQLRITTRQLAEATGVHQTTAMRRLHTLRSCNQIASETHRDYTLVTILNWPRYQPEWVDDASETHRKRIAGASETHHSGELELVPRTKREPEGFAPWYEGQYPHRVKRPDAAKAFGQVNPDPEALRVGTQRWVDHWSKQADPRIPYPATFLRARQWEDDPKPQLNGHRRITAQPIIRSRS